jgi:hypothetical protein
MKTCLLVFTSNIFFIERVLIDCCAFLLITYFFSLQAENLLISFTSYILFIEQVFIACCALWAMMHDACITSKRQFSSSSLFYFFSLTSICIFVLHFEFFFSTSLFIYFSSSDFKES